MYLRACRVTGGQGLFIGCMYKGGVRNFLCYGRWELCCRPGGFWIGGKLCVGRGSLDGKRARVVYNVQVMHSNDLVWDFGAWLTMRGVDVTIIGLVGVVIFRAVMVLLRFECLWKKNSKYRLYWNWQVGIDIYRDNKFSYKRNYSLKSLSLKMFFKAVQLIHIHFRKIVTFKHYSLFFFSIKTLAAVWWYLISLKSPAWKISFNLYPWKKCTQCVEGLGSTPQS